MQSSIPIAERTIQTEDGNSWILEYSLRSVLSGYGEALYGLRVDKRCMGGTLHEREETPAITASLDDATALAWKFVEGTVPPCVLLEMTDEWFDGVTINC